METENKIQFVVGDATCPIGDGQKFIVHCCNDIGAWGAGFVLALSKKWKEPERQYREWFLHGGISFELGAYRIVVVDKKNQIAVVNLIGQRGIGKHNGSHGVPIRYWAIKKGFETLTDFLTNNNFPKPSVHMPRIGCGLAGGEWAEIEKILQETICKTDIPVIVYDFN